MNFANDNVTVNFKKLLASNYFYLIKTVFLNE